MVQKTRFSGEWFEIYDMQNLLRYFLEHPVYKYTVYSQYWARIIVWRSTGDNCHEFKVVVVSRSFASTAPRALEYDNDDKNADPKNQKDDDQNYP